jgi:nitroimidazol reductase NimA-like FMN-containing flavoprotein (pyridoxamine 5'-phosphate oxidase superfamily)
MENIKGQKLKAFEFLCDNRLGVVSTISYKTQKPEGALVYYVVDQKFIYFITPRQSRKLANINQDNNIAFTVFTEISPMELQLQGTVESIDDPEKKSHISKIYLENANKNPDTINWPPVLKVPNDEGFIFVKVTTNWFKFSDFSEREGNIVEGTPTDWE